MGIIRLGSRRGLQAGSAYSYWLEVYLRPVKTNLEYFKKLCPMSARVGGLELSSALLGCE